MSQSKRSSLVESVVNTGSGAFISYAVTLAWMPAALRFGLDPADPLHAAIITGPYFLAALARSYVVRRAFNRRARFSRTTQERESAC